MRRMNVSLLCSLPPGSCRSMCLPDVGQEALGRGKALDHAINWMILLALALYQARNQNAPWRVGCDYKSLTEELQMLGWKEGIYWAALSILLLPTQDCSWQHMLRCFQNNFAPDTFRAAQCFKLSHLLQRFKCSSSEFPFRLLKPF